MKHEDEAWANDVRLRAARWAVDTLTNELDEKGKELGRKFGSWGFVAGLKLVAEKGGKDDVVEFIYVAGWLADAKYVCQEIETKLHLLQKKMARPMNADRLRRCARIDDEIDKMLGNVVGGEDALKRLNYEAEAEQEDARGERFGSEM